MADVQWDETKENFQPLKRGRDQKALESAVRSVEQTKSEYLNNCKSTFWDEIRTYVGDAPLQPWIRYKQLHGMLELMVTT